MAVYERTTRVRAPFEEVWEFHATTDGLVALTPNWLGLKVEEVTGPDGEPDPAELVEGSEIQLSLRPFGVGPRRRTKSVIVERREQDGTAFFRDRMVEGPFSEWLHTHAFYAGEDDTIVRDRVEYELPGGAPGRLAARAMVVGMAPMFRYRHRRTRELLED
ncbi:hypothetical protein L593_00280 [Salinarchaeum sp. Harcht-Bsk1]|uniref:SRPBCC family protein n=1 Tax=Salinarchaeum sp. Harcht-Bsk1 TaxID=1333523 RepID=UPI0003422F58|nr:SRPBCC family protein [Salinarchaeum sp. Harcht-Bsk1]AGN00011.1 hypothetical protein L593_00280 [Salinarchaeum sp. Harcht-Bsk1]